MMAFLAGLPLLTMLILMVFIEKSAVVSCTFALVVSIIVARVFFLAPLTIIIGNFIYAILTSWELVYLVFAGVLFATFLDKQGIIHNIVAIMSDMTGSDKSIQLNAILLGVVPLISALMGPGVYFLAIPLMIAIGVSPMTAIAAFLLTQSWGLVNFTFGAPCIALATSANISPLDLARVSSLLMTPLILVSCLILRLTVISLQTIPLRKYLFVSSSVAFSFLIGGMLGPAFPTLFAGIGGLVSSSIITRRARKKQLESANLTYKNTFIDINVDKGENSTSVINQFLSLVVVVTAFLISRTHFFMDISAACSFRIIPPFCCDSIAINLLGASGTPIMVGLLVLCVQKKRRNKWNMLDVLKESYKRASNSLLVIPLALCIARVMSASGMMKTLTDIPLQFSECVYIYLTPILGMLGHYVTGSLLSGNLIIGGVIAETSRLVGASPTLISSIATVGGSIVSSIIPCKVSISAAAAGCRGVEGAIVRKNAWVVLILLGVLCGIIRICL